MRFFSVVLSSGYGSKSKSIPQRQIVRTLSTNIFGNRNDDNQSKNPTESNDDFQHRIFGGILGNDSKSNSVYEKLDKLERAHDSSGQVFSQRIRSGILDGFDESFDTLSDGMDGRLKKAATYFEFDPDEIWEEDYTFRPDTSFRPGNTYEPKDLDLTKPAALKPFRRPELETTTEEVLRKADFRNVKFLAQFLTDGGIIVKRSSTKISAKAQRKLAREIKTARAFGFLPFTTMGTKSFVPGRTMEGLDEDFQYESYDGHPVTDANARRNYGGL